MKKELDTVSNCREYRAPELHQWGGVADITEHGWGRGPSWDWDRGPGRGRGKGRGNGGGPGFEGPAS